jgi:lipopolysaccharide export system protein LptA
MLVKRLKKLGMVFAILLSLGLTANQPMELVAPNGGELDLKRNVMKYYASKTAPVEVRWDNYVLEATYLEYNRNQALIKGTGRIKLTQTKPVLRTLRSEEIMLDLNKEIYIASQNVRFDYDRQTTVTAAQLEWEQARGRVLFSGRPLIVYQDWKLSGETVEGLMTDGLFTIAGSVKALSQDMVITAGKLIFNRQTEQYLLQERPVLVKGVNQLTATEIIYDVKTQTVSAKGVVQSKIIKEQQ